MARRRKEQGDPQPWQSPCDRDISLYSKKKDFNYVFYQIVAKWQMIQVCFLDMFIEIQPVNGQWDIVVWCFRDPCMAADWYPQNGAVSDKGGYPAAITCRRNALMWHQRNIRTSKLPYADNKCQTDRCISNYLREDMSNIAGTHNHYGQARQTIKLNGLWLKYLDIVRLFILQQRRYLSSIHLD